MDSSGQQVVRLGIYIATVVIIVGGFSVGASALPAAPGEHTLTQPNGEEITGQQWGNEFNHGWETTDGYTIIQGSDGWWRYATNNSGKLVPTNRVVGQDSPPADVPKHVRGAHKTSPALATTSSVATQTASAQMVGDVKTTGTVNLPVILINYADTSTTYSEQDFQQLTFGDNPENVSGPGSMKEYYQEASYGKLNLSGGDAGVHGWVTADHGHDYYGGSEIDQQTASLAREAVAKADSDVDFSQYDNDNDGVVEGVIVIHQGPGEEMSGDPTDIWSHQWSFTGAGLPVYETDDGVYINSYTLQPETSRNGQQTSVGVLAHETGHLLGMTDLYDSDGSSAGIGKWGLMGTGSWNGVNRLGDSPAHPVAYHKLMMGWTTSSKHPLNDSMVSLDPYSNHSQIIQWRDNPNGVEIGGEGEYFLATNRGYGGFDAALPGQGVIITHVDETRTDNDNESRKLVDIEAADGERDLDKGRNRGDPGDPFPGITGQHTFNSTTIPNSTLYDGTISGVSFSNIAVIGTEITLNPKPVANVSPTALQYGDVHVDKNRSMTVQISNVGKAPLSLESISMAGNNTTEFAPTTEIANQTLDVNETQSIEITYSPTERGEHRATLEVEHNAATSPIAISLAGRGVAPDHRASMEQVTFGKVSTAVNSTERLIQITNTGTADLKISNASVTGVNENAFSLVGHSTNFSTIVKPGASTNYTLQFNASTTGNYSADLVLTTNVSSDPEIRIPVTGTVVEGPPALTGFTNPPQNIDDDSQFEDVNGNGDQDIGDVQALYVNRETEMVQSHVYAFDYNVNGEIDIGDVQTLFVEYQQRMTP